jgi:hypothetical protein
MSKLENRYRPRGYRINSVLVSQFIILVNWIRLTDLLVIIILLFSRRVVFVLDVY